MKRVNICLTRVTLPQSMHISQLQKSINPSTTTLVSYETFKDVILSNLIEAKLSVNPYGCYVCYEKMQPDSVINDYVFVEVNHNKD